MYRLVEAVAMRLVWLVLLCSASTAAAQSVDEYVVYSQERDGNADIFLASVDGRDTRRLTTDPAADEIPRCSPDGRFVAFMRGGFERGDLYRVDLRTGDELRLTNDAIRDSTPQWSADGSRIYFTRREGKFDRLAVINRDGSGLRYLTGGEAWHDTMPGVSPDGRTLVHHTYRYPPATELHLLDLASQTGTRLTHAAGYDYEASFVGADRVVFSSNRDAKHYRLYVVSLADGHTRMLADTGADAWGSRYSPRSRRVVFHSGSPRQWRLFTVGIDGHEPPVPLLPDEFSKASADWCAPADASMGRSDEELGVSAMRAEMRPLAALAGIFDLSATETATDGSRFSERGTRTCRWVMGDTALQCEDDRTLIEAAGRYAQLPAHRRSLRIVRWNAVGKHYEQVEIGMTGLPTLRALAFDPVRATMSYASVVESSSTRQTLDSTSTLTIAADRHELVQHLKSRTTEFREEYTETAVRRR